MNLLFGLKKDCAVTIQNNIIISRNVLIRGEE